MLKRLRFALLEPSKAKNDDEARLTENQSIPLGIFAAFSAIFAFL